MFDLLRHRVRNNDSYRLLSQRFTRLKNRLLGSFVGVVGTVGQTSTWFTAGRIILRFAVFPTILALVALTLLLLPTYMPTPTWLAYVPGWKSGSAWVMTAPDLNIYVAVLGRVAAVAGVFIGLYFTAVSVVTSRAYDRVTREVRDLIINDVIGSVYMALVAHLAAVAVIAMAAVGIGIPPSRLVMAYTVVLGVVLIVSFFSMGKYVFDFFDPRRIVRGELHRKYVAAINAAAAGRLGAAVPACQARLRRDAVSMLGVMDDLVDHAAEGATPRTEVISYIASSMLNMLTYTAFANSRIPSDSRWFERTGSFSPWVLSSGTETSLAMQTGSALSAKEIPNHLFVSQHMSSMIRKAIKKLLDAGDLAGCAALMRSVWETSHQLGSAFCLTDCSLMLRAITDPLLDYLVKTESAGKDDDLAMLSSLGALGAGHLTAVLAAAQGIEHHIARGMGGTIRSLKRFSPDGIYRVVRPRFVLKEMERMHAQLHFERSVEGRLLSPDWYIEELVSSAYAKYIADFAREATGLIEDAYRPIERLAHAKRSLAAAHLLQECIGAIKKTDHWLARLHAVFDNLVSRAVTKENWDEIKFPAVEESLKQLRVKAIQQLVALVPSLPVKCKNDDLPDHLGFARAVLCQEVVDRMSSQDDQGFGDVFQAVFLASWRVFDAHQLQPSGAQLNNYHLNVAMETVLDLLDLSGAALLFSELNGTGFYKVVGQVWDGYFAAAGVNGKTIMASLLAIIGSKLRLPIMSPLAQSRYDRHQAFVQAMERAGLRVDAYEEPCAPKPKPHKSPIIRTRGPHMGLMFQEPAEFFAAIYLCRRPEAVGIEVPRGVQECLKEIDREHKRSEQDAGGVS